MSRLLYKALTPTDSAEQVEEYLEALTWALQQKDIHNIALAGAYGSGKSSIIETFLRNEREERACEEICKQVGFIEWTCKENGGTSVRMTDVPPLLYGSRPS